MSNTTRIEAFYVDTCLPDYLQDGHTRDGETLCLAPLGCTESETVDALYESIDWDADIPESIDDEDIKTALADAIQGVDLRAVDEDGNRIDGEAPESDGDEPYVYVYLKWDATKISMRLTVDVEYLANGTDPYDLKQILENLIRHASGDGALSGGTDAEVIQWGATAEPVERETQDNHLSGVRGE